MGPCELMDLIGHDTNFSVTQSVFEANFFDKRFVPSLVQRELVDGGLLGRKSGRGFYDYAGALPNRWLTPLKPHHPRHKRCGYTARAHWQIVLSQYWNKPATPLSATTPATGSGWKSRVPSCA